MLHSSSDCRREVYLTGFGLISPVGKNPEEYLSRLDDLGFGLTPRLILDESDNAGASCKCHSLNSKDIVLPIKRSIRRFLSGAGQMFASAAVDAISQSCLTPEQLTEFGVAVGTNNSDRPIDFELSPFREVGDKTQNYYKYLLKGGASRALRTQPGMMGGVISIWLGANGPNLVFINPGIAGATAIGEAYRSVVSDDCPGYVVGGTFDIDDPWIVLSRNTEESDFSLPLMSGAACITIESAEFLRKRHGRPLAEIVAYSDNSVEHLFDQFDQELDFIIALAAVPRSISRKKRYDRFDIGVPIREIATDLMSASSTILVSLAAHQLMKSPNPSGCRPAALVSVDYGCGQVHIVLAKPFAPWTNN